MSQVAAAVAATVNKSRVFALTVTGKDGKPEIVKETFSAALIDVASRGMEFAFQADNLWANTYADFVTRFWGDLDIPAKTGYSSIIDLLRTEKKRSYEMLVDFLTQSHPQYSRAEGYAEEMKKADPKSLRFDEQKTLWKKARSRCEETAVTQARAIIGYFAEANEEKESADARKLPGAHSTIQGWIVQGNKMLAKPRGPMKAEEEQALMRAFVSVATQLLAQNTKAITAKFVTSTLGAGKELDVSQVSLESPQVAAVRDQSEKKAGKVTVLKGEAAAKAIAK